MPNHYETVVILSPLLSEEDVKREIARITKTVTDAGATIVEERNWGLRQLAYPIQAKSNGIYYIMEFEGPSTLVSRLEVEYKRDENIIRFLTVKLDKYGIDYNDRRRKGLVGKKKDSKDEKELNSVSAEA
ncbi:MAG: 30S ribosomal protein S6 [Chitinophagales bacterium]|nr:30S ribosomal protein S6 [Chitinophagales bacterium]